MPLRAAHRDDRLQNPASALGQGTHPDQHQDSAPGLPLQHIHAQQGRGCLPPHGQSQLSAHGRHVGAADACHDLPLLYGLVPDAAHRRAPLYRIHLLHRGLLRDEPARALSQELEEDLLLSAFPHGARHRPHRHQYQGRHGSAVRNQEPLRAHAQVSCGAEGPEIPGRQVSQASQARPLDRTAAGLLLHGRHSLHLLESQLLHRAIPHPLCDRLLVHGPDELATGPLRALAHWR